MPQFHRNNLSPHLSTFLQFELASCTCRAVRTTMLDKPKHIQEIIAMVIIQIENKSIPRTVTQLPNNK
jgi:hypothetical protein